MADSCQVIVQPLALDDMTQIVTYVAKELDSPEAAQKLASRFVEGIESLSKLPARCPLYQPPRPLRHEYRRLAVGNYLVFFWVSEEEEMVTVVRVIYGYRNLPKMIE